MDKMYYKVALLLVVLTIAAAMWQQAPSGASMALAVIGAGFAIASVLNKK